MGTEGRHLAIPDVHCDFSAAGLSWALDKHVETHGILPSTLIVGGDSLPYVYDVVRDSRVPLTVVVAPGLPTGAFIVASPRMVLVSPGA